MSSDSPAPSSANEQIAAHARAAELAGLPWPDRLRIVRQDRSFAVPSFIELAIGLARDVSLLYAEREEWARLGVEAAHQGSSKRVRELGALAWAVLGNIRRVRGRLVASHAAFMRCRALRSYVRDPLELAEILDLEAALWDEVQELGTAAELNLEALRLATSHGTDDVIGFYLIRGGMIAADGKDWSAALAKELSALERIDPATHPRLALGAAHNLALSAVQLGHLDTAMCAMLRLERNYHAFADPAFLAKREGLLGEIARARGYWREAELRFHAVRRVYISLQLPLHAARIDFNVAELAAETNRWPTAAHFAARAARALSAAGSPREAEAASHLLREAITRRRGPGK